MKFIKKTNGKRDIKISKKEWENIGKKYNWKIAMPVPITEEQRREMAKEGIYVMVDILDKLPNIGKRDIAATIKNLQEQGVGDFFNTLDPKNAIMLPAIYKADPSKLIEIDGHQYYVVNVTEPRDVKKKSIINGLEYQKGDRYGGEIICMDVETGLPVPFIFDEVVDKIKTPTQNREQTMAEMNDEIIAWNKRVDAIDKAIGPTKLGLQVGWIEQKIIERIATLDVQIEALTRKQQNPLKDFPSYANWVQTLRDGVKNGQFNLRDVFDSLLFLYQANTEQLMQGIQDGTVQVPDELKNGLLAIAAQELMIKGEKDVVEMQKQREKETRMEEELAPDKEPIDEPLRPVTLEDIPEQKYKKLTQNRTLAHWAKSIEVTISGIQKDKEQLQSVLDSLNGLRTYVAELQKGQRANDFLRSPEGQEIVQDLREFLDKAQVFIKRYSTDIVADNTINPKLMGRGGTMGNALLAVALNRIYVIIKKTLDEVSVPEEVLIEASNKKVSKMEKLSELLWQVFENRTNLR